MQIAKWGNSLAVRIPANVARELGLRKGDKVDLVRLEDEKVAVLGERQRRAAALKRLQELAVPFPPDYRFDREEANSR